MLLGLAVGDALGTTLEFTKEQRPLSNFHTEMIGGGEFNLNPGQWTDDTSMALAIADSLISLKKFDPFDILKKWCEWYQEGKYSCTGTRFDCGYATQRALIQYIKNPKNLPTVPTDALGNAPLMRLAPVILFARDLEEAKKYAYDQSVLTHASEVGEAAYLFGEMLYNALHGKFDKSVIPEDTISAPRKHVHSSGYYKDTYEAALWAVGTTDNFEDAVVQAVNLGDDADTVGAVAGQLAGAMYGYPSIPIRWLETLSWKKRISTMAEQLIERNL